MSKPICLITGVGPGTGTALVERFSPDYEVAMVSRNEDRLAGLESRIAGTHSYPCDVSDFEKLAETVEKIRSNLGDPEILIHNAVGGAFGDFLSIQPKILNRNFQINTMALLHLGQMLAPAMMENGKGVILSTGNTAAYRGGANFAGFAPTKAAQRILSESMARAIGPKGVHVAYVAIDAVIDLAWTRERYPDKPDDFFCAPKDIADHCWQVAHQPRTAWTFDSKIRPYGESW